MCVYARVRANLSSEYQNTVFVSKFMLFQPDIIIPTYYNAVDKISVQLYVTKEAFALQDIDYHTHLVSSEHPAMKSDDQY